MGDVESLAFKIGLSGTYWDRKPEFEIRLNNKLITSGKISADSGSTEYFTFTSELEPGNHVLGIRLLNKQITDTVQSEDKSTIVNDLLLNIESIEIDEVEVGMCKWYESVYILDTPAQFNNQTVTQLEKCVNLGFNGEYQLKFTSPYYIWLLEQL